MIKHFFKLLVTSLEIYIFGFSILLSFVIPGVFDSLYELVFPPTSTDAKYIALGAIFSIFIIPSIICSQKILFPKEDNKNLLEYDKYEIIKLTVYFGDTWIVLCILLIILSLAGQITFIKSSSLVVSSTVSGLISMITLYLASNKMREIIEINN